MRNPRVILTGAAVGLLVGLVSPSSLAAQEEEEAPWPGTVVFSQNKCPSPNMPKIDAALDSIFAPVLDELVEEGMLVNWGILTHSWGDEWNWNVYYGVENHRAFLDFWSEYIGRLNERHPGWWQQVWDLCTDHKDNIYTHRRPSE
ncbi:MAG: hypothetical protein GTO63_33335 [Anaerolineae bacterium]|nr:hypothetical protein [Anaerolineae bacterium]NIN99536.1 hypothetical protein [Anaerolineae bacterium]